MNNNKGAKTYTSVLGKVFDFGIGFFVPIFLGPLFLPLTILVVKIFNVETFGFEWSMIPAIFVFFYFKNRRKFLSIGALFAFIFSFLAFIYLIFYGLSRYW